MRRMYNFNPRTPCGVRPGAYFSTMGFNTISIHALRAECDRLCRRLRLPALHFNPRTPCGVRLYILCIIYQISTIYILFYKYNVKFRVEVFELKCENAWKYASLMVRAKIIECLHYHKYYYVQTALFFLSICFPNNIVLNYPFLYPLSLAIYL